MIKYKLKIIDIVEEVPGVWTYFLEKPEEFTWIEGAHMHVGLPGFDEGEMPNKDMVRHMSIMTLPEENKIGFTTRVLPYLSEFKEKLSKLHIGEEVTLFKVGSRMFLRRENRPIVLVSMGVGISTMRPLIYGFIKDKTGIPGLVNINVNSSRAFVYKSELNKLENSFYQNYWLDSRTSFYEELDKASDQPDAIYYIVGSDTFIKEVIKFLKSKEIEENSLLIDKKEEQSANYYNG